MPHRTILVWIAVLGLLAVFLLILLGRDPERAANLGPRWKRRLIAAGLGLLALFGYHPALHARKPKQQGNHLRRDLSQNRDWQQVLKTYREADKIASGSWYSEPFDRAGKKQLLADLTKAATLIDRLRAAGHLSETEAALVKTQLQDLRARVSRTRVKMPGRRPTCYKPAPPKPAYRRSVANLHKQLPLLQRIRRQKVLHPEVLRLVKKRIERDLANAEKPTPGWPRPKPGELSRAKKLGRYARTVWNRIWNRIWHRVTRRKQR